MTVQKRHVESEARATDLKGAPGGASASVLRPKRIAPHSGLFVSTATSGSYRDVPADEPTVDFTGGPPGSCAIDLVRDDTVPFLFLVCVIDLLQVPPPSLAIALA